MILTVNIGNAHITIGCMQERTPVFVGFLPSDVKKTDLEYAIDLYRLFSENSVDPKEVSGGIISSVVPKILPVMKEAVRRLFSFEPLEVELDKLRGLHIALDDPKVLGMNLVADSVAAVSLYGAPVIVVDMGSATSVCVISREKHYLGGVILPGMESALSELFGGTAQLSAFPLRLQDHVYATNTEDCINAGAVFGNAGMIDGILDRIMEDPALKSASVVICGHLSAFVIPYMKHRVIEDRHLILKGLSLIYEQEVTGHASDR